jgi:hypothetical protein
MCNRTRNPRAPAHREIVTSDGLITMPPDSPKILIVETQDDPCRTVHPSYLAMLSTISPQTSAKVVGG